MKIRILILSLFLVSCSSGDEQKLFKDPISGQETLYDFVAKDGWNFYTSTEGGWLLIERDGELVASIMENENGREVNLQTKTSAFPTVQLTSHNGDHLYELIKYGNGDVEVTDYGLDGEIDGLLNCSKKSILVNYKGKLIQLQGEGKEKYIMVDGVKINMKYVDGIFVPTAANTHNKTLKFVLGLRPSTGPKKAAPFWAA